MKRSYSHLDLNKYSRTNYETTILRRSTSPLLWQGNPIVTTFLVYIQAIIAFAANQIKSLQNYQNPIDTKL